MAKSIVKKEDQTVIRKGEMYICKLPNQEFIVLCTRVRDPGFFYGVIIASPNGGPIGDYMEFQVENFLLFHGEVTLVSR
jgi:hypothetical protein